jgi:hypothetical protein
VVHKEELVQALQLAPQAVQVDSELTKKPTLHRTHKLLTPGLH